jgi:hypothetical protein
MRRRWELIPSKEVLPNPDEEDSLSISRDAVVLGVEHGYRYSVAPAGIDEAGELLL